MSWSVSVFGKASKVAEAIETTVNANLTGQSKEEWDAAKVHLSALVRNNFCTDEYKKQYPTAGEPMVKLDASGSGTKMGDVMVQGSCNVKLETIYTNLV